MEVAGVETPVSASITFLPVPFMQVPYALSRDGVLAYTTVPSRDERLELIDLEGNRHSVTAGAMRLRGVRFAPDGRRAAVSVGLDVWSLDMERDLMSRMSSDARPQVIL